MPPTRTRSQEARIDDYFADFDGARTRGPAALQAFGEIFPDDAMLAPIARAISLIVRAGYSSAFSRRKPGAGKRCHYTYARIAESARSNMSFFCRSALWHYAAALLFLAFDAHATRRGIEISSTPGAKMPPAPTAVAV